MQEMGQIRASFMGSWKRRLALCALVHVARHRTSAPPQRYSMRSGGRKGAEYLLYSPLPDLSAPASCPLGKDGLIHLQEAAEGEGSRDSKALELLSLRHWWFRAQGELHVKDNDPWVFPCLCESEAK